MMSAPKSNWSTPNDKGSEERKLEKYSVLALLVAPRPPNGMPGL
jgi:hypothetical protein